MGSALRRFGMALLLAAWAGWIATPAALAEDRALTTTGRHSPSCSPLQDLVTYVEYGVLPSGAITQHLFVMDLRAEETRRLSKQSMVWDPSFSYDGTRIVCCAIKVDDPDKAGLWIVIPDGSSTALLWQGPTRIAPFAPAFSPDGTDIAFIQSVDDKGERAGLWTMDYLRRQRLPHPLHPSLTLSVGSGLMWMPDSRRLRFVATEKHGQAESLALFEIDTEKDKVKRVMDLDSKEDPQDFAISPDGTKMAYTRRAGPRRELVLLEAGGGPPRVLATLDPPPVVVERPYESDASFTRDSAAVVYTAGWELRIADAIPGGRGSAEVYVEGCRENLADIHSALQRYALGHGGRMPSQEDSPNYQAVGPDFWLLALRTLLDDPRHTACPADPDANDRPSYVISEGLFGAMWDDVVAARGVLVMDRYPFHGGKRMVIYSDGSIGEIEAE